METIIMNYKQTQTELDHDDLIKSLAEEIETYLHKSPGIEYILNQYGNIEIDEEIPMDSDLKIYPKQFRSILEMHW